MKTIKIFLASSLEELEQDRDQFDLFLRKLNDIFEKRGICIKIVRCEDLGISFKGRPTEDEYLDALKDCHLFVALFYKKAGQYTVKEFRLAQQLFDQHGKPNFIVFMKDIDENEISEELKIFREYLDKDLKYFWPTYDSHASLKLQLVMWLLRTEFSNMSVLQVENGEVTIDGFTIALMSQLSFAANNKEYQELEERLKALNEDINQLKQDIEDYPENPNFPERLSKKVRERDQIQRKLDVQQEALLGAAKRITMIEKQKVGKKLKEAIDAFNQGQLHVANHLLDTIAYEGESHIKQLDQDRDLVHQDIEALLLQTQTVMADVEKPIDERVSRVAKIYAKADDWAACSAYGKEKYAKLLYAYAQFLDDYGYYEEAEQIYLRQIAFSEELYGTDSTETAESYNDIGVVYYRQCDYEKALTYYFKALDIDEKVLGTNHPDTAIDYNNIGRVYDNLGDYEKALRYYFDSLAVWKDVLGSEHTLIAISYNNIGLAYDNQGDYDKALDYHFKALAIREKILDADHPYIAQSYNNIGAVYNAQGDYEKALEFHFKALAIREKMLGIDHPNTSQSYKNIGLAYMNSKVYDKALKYLDKALNIYEEKLGDGHPDTISVLECIEKVKEDIGGIR